MENLFASASATIIAELITLPICTLRTNYINHHDKNVFETIKRINSVKNLYQASNFAIGGQIISTSSKYVLYEYFKPKFRDVPYNNFLAGTLSGACSTLLTHPLDSLKIHAQMNTSLKELKLLYRGYSRTLLKGSIGSTLFFPLFDTYSIYCEQKWQASFLSALTSTILIQPFDYMKIRRIYGLNHSYKNYFRGLGLNVCRIVPHFMITMYCIEEFKKLL